MDLILGMDLLVFIAWIGTILAAVLCVLYGIYHWYLEKSSKRKSSAEKNKQSSEREVK